MPSNKSQDSTIATIEASISQGYDLRREGEPEQAKKIFLKAVNASKDLEDEGASAKRVLARSLTGLGQIERDLGEVPASLQHYQESAELYRTLDDPLTLAHTVRHVADIMRQNGDHVPAVVAFYNEALMIYRDHPKTKPLDLANTLRGYALLKADTGHAEAAVSFLQEAREIYSKAATETGLDLQPAFDECDREIERLSKTDAQSEV